MGHWNVLQMVSAHGEPFPAWLMLGIAVFFVAMGLLADAIADGLGSLAGSLWGVVRG